MPDGETFTCINDRWTVESRTPYHSSKDLMGYIIKHMESRLRVVTGYKTKISANKSTLYKATESLMNKGISFLDITASINMAVNAFYKDRTRVVVEVNRLNLSRIRDEANETQEKLIVPEGEVAGDKGTVLPSCWDAQDVKTVPLSPEPTASETVKPEDRPHLSHDKSHRLGEADSSHEANDIWMQFKNSLTPTESGALSALLLNTESINTFAHRHGIMPEILADGINEKAMEVIGDNILDEALAIYDDYKTNIHEILS